MVSRITDHSILMVLVVLVRPIARKLLAILAFHWCLKQPEPDSSQNILIGFGCCRVVRGKSVICLHR